MAPSVAMRTALVLAMGATSAWSRFVPRADGLNTTTTTTSASPAGSCKADCTMTYPSLFEYTWQTVSATSTVTAATIVVIVNTILNTTSTSTIFNTLPEGLTLPPTNSAGTQTCDVTVTRGNSLFITTLTYPEIFRDYEITYEWYGTLSTDGTCSTVNGQTTVTLPSHPAFDSFTPTGSIFTPTATDAAESSAFAATPTPLPPGKGLDYACMINDISGLRFSPFLFFDQSFPDQAAFQSCGFSAKGPVGALVSVSFVTDTSTSIDDTVPTSPAAASQTPTTSETTTLLPAETGPSPSPAASQSPVAQTPSPTPSPSPSPSPNPIPDDSGSSGSSSSSSSPSNSPPSNSNPTGSGDGSNGNPGNGSGSSSNSPAAVNPTPTPTPTPTPSPTPTPVPTPAPVIITVNPGSSIVIPPSAIPTPGGTTVLTAGPSSLTLSATTDGNGQTVVVVSAGGASTAQTITVSSQLPEPAGQTGVGSLILSGLGGPVPVPTGGNATTTAPLEYTGAASATFAREGKWVGVVMGVVAAVIGGVAVGM